MKTELVDISGLDKAELLSALHTLSHSLGLGALHDVGPLSVQECQQIIDGVNLIAEEKVVGFRRANLLKFDYLRGRVMKCDLSEDQVDPWGYDRDNGPGALSRVVSKLRDQPQG
jgi:hypothetical protein